MKQKDFAAIKNIKPSTLRASLKQRSELELLTTTTESERNKTRSLKYQQLEVLLKYWISKARSANMPITGSIIQETAQELAKSVGITDFNASSGWLERFRNKPSVFYTEKNEALKEIDLGSASNWKKALSIITEGYKPSEIYNADEFRLFYKRLPEMLIDKSEEGYEPKLSKERITILVCMNSTGMDKRELVIIGKYAKPPSFNNVRTLPCMYTSQPQAWMTQYQFYKWLEVWEDELKRQKRKILLFLDNCSAHPKISELKHIKLVFLPKTRRGFQPLDMGIIKALKYGYKRQIIQKYLLVKDSLPEITILDAMHFLYAAWKDIKEEAIFNCFIKAGFSLASSTKTKSAEQVSYI